MAIVELIYDVKAPAWVTGNTNVPKLGEPVYLTNGTYAIGDNVTQVQNLTFYGGTFPSTPALQQVLSAGSALTQNNTITGAFNLEFDHTNFTAKSTVRSRLIADDGVNQHYFDADIISGHAHIHSTIEIHGMAPKYLLETLSTNHSINMEDGVGWRASVNGGNSDIFLSELTNEIYAYSTSKFTVDAPLFRLTNLTASTVPYLNGTKDLVSSAVTPTELGYLSGVTSSVQTQLTGKEPTITAGTTAQYWRGDKTWQSLNTGIDTRVQAYTGDVTLTGTTFAIGASKVTNAMLAGSITYSKISGALTTNTLYGTDYGIVADGVTDNTAAFNTFMAACKAGQYKGELPLGSIVFLSKPNDIDFAWDLGGKGLNGTVLIRKYNEATPANGLINIVAASGVKIHDMAIESASGQTGGSMVSITSTSSYATSGITLENLWLSTFGSDTQSYSLYFDGSAKTTAPAGVRDVSLKNVHVFGSTNYSASIKSVIGMNWSGGGVYPAGGTGSLSGGIAISGVSSVKSQYLNINIVTCGGLNLTNCLNVVITSPTIGAISGVSVNNDSTCSLTSITGSLSGTLTTSWLTSFCNDIGNKMSFDGGKVRITNGSGGTTPTNYLELVGSTANNTNFPGIQFTGGTSPTTYASIQPDNSGQGFSIRNGSSATFPNYQKLFMFTNSTTASSYTEIQNAGTSVFKVFGTGSVILGSPSALATNATDGFAYMPSGAGTPTGTPTAITGKTPFYYDSTNNKIYIYNGGWKATAALT